MENLPAIAIIGSGKVGTTIASLAKQKGYRVSAISGRDLKKAEAIKDVQLVLLTVSDDAIESVCNELVAQKAFLSNQIVAHVSGALSSEVLVKAQKECGAKIASVHPLQIFSIPEQAVKALPGTYWFLEGDQGALIVLKEFVEKLDGIPQTITAKNKVLYHCASVFACNYLTSLMDVALTVAEEANLDRQLAWQALLPLIQATINNIGKLGTADALTGPIARGDIETVNRHLKALADKDPEISEVYKALGKWTVKLATQKKSIRQQVQPLLDVLANK